MQRVPTFQPWPQTVNSVNQAQTWSVTKPEMETSLLGLQAGWWNIAMFAMLGITLIAICLLAAAATGVIIIQRQDASAQARATEEYKAEAAHKIAQARAVAAQAVERAAAASERAARLEKESQELRERNLALERGVPVAAPSVQPSGPSSQAFLTAIAGAAPGRADITYKQECANCLWLAQWLSGLLGEAGWRVNGAEPAAQAATLSEKLASLGKQGWAISVVARDPSEPAHHKHVRPYNALMAALGASLGRAATLSEEKEEALADDHVKIRIAPAS